MAKTVSILTLVLLTITLAKSANIQNVDVKKIDQGKENTEMTTASVVLKTLPVATMQDQNDEGDQGKIDDVDLMAAMIECNDTFRIEMSYLEALNESGSFPDETDRNPKCYVRCVLEKTAVASEDGVFDAARAAVVFAGERGGKPMDNIEEMAAACTNRNESCKCERAYNFMKCLMEMEIKNYETYQ